MHEMFQLSAPWWHFSLRAVVVYVLVMLLVRLSGKRAVGQFTPFDLVLLILIGNAVQNGMNGGDNSLTGAVILAVCLIVLNYGVAFVAARSPRARIFIEGKPVVLARDGKIFRDVLKRELVSNADFLEAMRETGCSEIEKIRVATLETNGRISIVLADHEPSSP
jgi:uncharacterized membrane protein YcaP (DUF421 family)